MADLVIGDPLPSGTWVMLTEDAPPELALLWGSEAVMRVYSQSSCDLTPNTDGDLIGTRRYYLIHQHRGRLVWDVSEKHLQVIDPEAAQGQRLLHGEMARDWWAAAGAETGEGGDGSG